MINPMERIGVSLHPEVVLHQPRSRIHRQLCSAFPGENDLLPWLKQLGVRYIELRAISGALEPAQYLQFVEKVWQQDMRVTLHGTLPAKGVKEELSAYAPVYQAVLSQQEQTVLVVHSLDTKDDTIRQLGAMAEGLRAFPGIRLALENQRIRDAEHPHYSFANVAQAAAQCGTGITWDMGHYAYNIQKEISSLPPARLLRQVIHTHIHSISANGDTHHWLTEEPVREYLLALQAVGYDGVFNLELFSSTYPETSSPRQTLEDAICLLKQLLK